MKKLQSLSVVFPAYNDVITITLLIKHAQAVAATLTDNYEIIVIDDASTDDTKKVLEKMQKRKRFLKVFYHKKNRGYGATIAEGFRRATKTFIFYTDGDGQYDVRELARLAQAMNPSIDMVTGYKLIRSDPWFRKAIGGTYNRFVKLAFRLKVRDVDCDFRLFRKRILKGVTLSVTSGAFDVEFMKKLEEKRVRFKEVPVYHYPRLYGTSKFFNPENIVKSLFDLGKLWIANEKNNTIH